MGGSKGPDIRGKRLAPAEYAANFSDLHPPLDAHEALVESDRCYFCHDAPCQTACPTGIDIPMFIRQINSGLPKVAAKTIFDENILGGMCARVCPTETLCEEACVREAAEGKPVKIGMLQRFATDALMATGRQPYARGARTDRRIAVVGGGPAGLACAHRLAMHGHEVTIFDARPKSGGLNEYGIASYKTVDGFAQKEVDYILSIGGITMVNGRALGKGLKLADLQKDYDAVFLAMGLAGVNALEAKHDDADGVDDAVGFIEELRQAKDLAKLKVGRRVVVIGGGMTAIDAAVQAKLLGAEDVTIVYRRGAAAMKASAYEQDLAQTKGVKIKHWAMPKKVVVKGGAAVALECEYTAEKKGKLSGTGETFRIEADMILKAIGQTFEPDALQGAIKLDKGRIKIDGERRTLVKGIWAGGDCAGGGQDLTVAAVEDGKRAAESIHAFLGGK